LNSRTVKALKVSTEFPTYGVNNKSEKYFIKNCPDCLFVKNKTKQICDPLIFQTFDICLNPTMLLPDKKRLPHHITRRGLSPDKTLRRIQIDH
jgi:hypothetical protein